MFNSRRSNFTLFMGVGILTILTNAPITQAQRGPGGRGGNDMPPTGFGGPRLVFEFDQIDTNSDNLLTKEEILTWVWNDISLTDEDRDEKYSRSEIERSRGMGGFRGGFPGGGRPGGPRGFGGGMGRGPSDSEFEKAPLPKDDKETKTLEVLDEIRANQSFQNVPPGDGRFLRILVEALNAKNVIEIGTSTGYSALWMGIGLQKTDGKLTTFEIDPRRAAVARDNFQRAGMTPIITLVEGDAHEEVKNLQEPIDILFLDADKEGYIDYLNKLLPLLRPGGLVIAHNINSGQADPNYISAITTNPDLETIVRSEVGITLKKR